MTRPTPPDDEETRPLVLVRPDRGEDKEAFKRRVIDAFRQAGLLGPPDEPEARR